MTNYDLIRYAKQLNIPNFRNVYMRDNLPKKPYKYESAIINLDSSNGSGTHWVGYKKEDNRVTYFDSFGNLPPCPELIKYFKIGNPNIEIEYNYRRQQGFDSVICGHRCLSFLAK